MRSPCCNTELTTIHETYKDDEYLKANRYFYHELLIKNEILRQEKQKKFEAVPQFETTQR